MMRTVSFLLPVVAATLLHALSPRPSTAGPASNFLIVSPSASAELEALFNSLDYAWPPADAERLPALSIESLPEDFDALDVRTRKHLFFRILAPLVAMENQQLREQREFLEHAFAQFVSLPPHAPITRRVREVARRFNISGDINDPAVRAALLRRVDVIPAALVLAQAANESGWGTSRFAREANNLFGMWTWDRNAGIAPRERSTGSRHFVRSFENLRGAVSNYLHTINVGPAYRELREIRARQRANGETPSALELANGLTRYSARGADYVREIRGIIRYNALDEIPPLRLQPSPPTP